jgi:hypothetical protein
MGLSFPKRPLRSSFGPKLRNAYPVENPAIDVGDVAFNGMFSTVAGLGLISARSIVIANYTGGAFVIGYQAEAWNQELSQAHPVLARSGAGLYSYTFASTYLDEDGVAVATDIKGPRPFSQADSSGTTVGEAFGWINPANPLQVLMRVGTRVVATGVFTTADIPFALLVQ